MMAEGAEGQMENLEQDIDSLDIENQKDIFEKDNNNIEYNNNNIPMVLPFP